MITKLRYIFCSLLIFQAASAQQPRDLEKLLDDYQASADNYFSEIRKIRPEPAAGRILQAKKRIKPGEISRSLAMFNHAWNTNAALLFYFHDGKNLNSYLLDEKGLVEKSILALEPDSLLQAEVDIRQSLGVYSGLSFNRRENLRGLRLIPKVKPGDTIYLQKITSRIIDPSIAKKLKQYDHLMICPTLNLYSFPFAALRPFEDEAYLGKTLPISIIPNLYELVSQVYPDSSFLFRDHIQRATLVGGPVFNPSYTPQDFYGRNKLIDEYYLQELPNTIMQTMGVRGFLMNVKTDSITINFLTHKEATVTNLKRVAPQSDLVYIATHAFSTSEHPWDSAFIAFAYEPGQGPGANFWSSRSICQSNFRARLAVLSACQTGTGQLWQAGILSLANSFYHAGVESVVSTLWNVEDFSTSMYMQGFMKALLEDGKKHPAYYLHKMQKETTLGTRHWAGFILFGI